MATAATAVRDAGRRCILERRGHDPAMPPNLSLRLRMPSHDAAPHSAGTGSWWPDASWRHMAATPAGGKLPSPSGRGVGGDGLAWAIIARQQALPRGRRPSRRTLSRRDQGTGNAGRDPLSPRFRPGRSDRTTGPAAPRSYLPMEAAEFDRLLGAIAQLAERRRKRRWRSTGRRPNTRPGSDEPNGSSATATARDRRTGPGGRAAAAGPAATWPSARRAGATPRPRRPPPGAWAATASCKCWSSGPADCELDLVARRAARHGRDGQLPLRAAALPGQPPDARSAGEADAAGRSRPGRSRPAPAGEGLRRWRIELGGHWRFRLRVAAGRRGRAAAATGPAAAVDGLRLLAPRRGSLRPVEAGGPQRAARPRLPLAIEPPLQLVAASCGDAPVPWSVAVAGRTSPRRWSLTLPQPLRDGTGVLRLQGRGPAGDRPAVAAAADPARGRLLAGRAATRCWCPPRCGSSRSQPVGCRQSGVEPLAAPRSGESLQFESLRPRRRAGVDAGPAPTAVQCVSGTATELGNGKMTSRVATDFRTAEGAQFSLEAAITPQWTIDSVESLPADALDDWSLEIGRRPKRLAVRLARPLTASAAVRLVVARPAAVSPRRATDLGIDDLVPLRFPARPTTSGWCRSARRAPYELKTRRRPSGCSSVEPAAARRRRTRSVRRSRRASCSFATTPAAPACRSSLENRKPSYTATIRVEASVGGGTLQESYRLACTPRSRPRSIASWSISRIAATPPLRWSIVGHEDEPASRPGVVAASVRRPPAGPDEETWESSSAGPAAHAARDPRHARDEAGRPLAGQPGLAARCRQQQATLVVRSLGPHPLRDQEPPPQADRHRAGAGRPVPDGPGDLPVRSAARHGRRGARPPLVDSRPTAAADRAWVWNCELQSQYAADGTGQHLLTYRVQSAGGGPVRLTLPKAWPAPMFTACGSTTNRVPPCPAAAATADAGRGSAAGREVPHRGGALHHAGRPLRRGWSLREPPLPGDRSAGPFAALDRHGCRRATRRATSCPIASVAAARRLTWSQRLFGTLGRSADQRAFNPFQPIGAWQTPCTSRGPTVPAGGRSPRRVDPARRAPTEATGWTAYRLRARPTCRRPGWPRPSAHDPLGGLAGSSCGGSRLGCGSSVDRPRCCSSCWPARRPWPAAACIPCVPVVAARTVWHPVRLRRWAARGRGRRTPPRRSRKPAVADCPAPITVVPCRLRCPLVALAMLLSPGDASQAADARQEPPAPTTYSVFIPVDDATATGRRKYLRARRSSSISLYRRAAARAEKPQGWLIAGGDVPGHAGQGPGTPAAPDRSVRRPSSICACSTRRRACGSPSATKRCKLLPGEAAVGRPAGPARVGRRRHARWRWTSPSRATIGWSCRCGRRCTTAAARPGSTWRSPGWPLAAGIRRARRCTGRRGPLGRRRGPLGRSRRRAGWPIWGPPTGSSVRWQDAAGGDAAPAVDARRIALAEGPARLGRHRRPAEAEGHRRPVPPPAVGGRSGVCNAAAGRPRRARRAGPHRSPASRRSSICNGRSPIAEPTTIDARFLWTGVSSVGNLRLPQLDVLDARPTRRWLAVSVDPALEYHLPGPGRRRRWPCPSSPAVGAPSTRPAVGLPAPVGPPIGTSPRGHGGPKRRPIRRWRWSSTAAASNTGSTPS